MPHKYSKKPLFIAIAALLTLLVSTAVFFASNQPSPRQAQQPASPQPQTESETVEPVAEPAAAYTGQSTIVGETFSIKTPDGWTASLSNSANFLAIMFARPNKLTTLTYRPDTPPAIDSNGIPSWSGLTEHFYVIAPLASRQFNESSHAEVSSERFTFDDGTIGKKYYVVKRADEAAQWGGLQKDSEWQGRTYVYEKDGERIEAHLALYPSTAIDVDFYEDVVRSIGLAGR